MATTNYLASFSIAVIAGIVAMIMYLLLKEVYIKIIRPEIENLSYKGAMIEGKWSAKCNYEAGPSEETWEIKRMGHHIKGIINVIQGTDKGTTWDIEGDIFNDLVTIVYSDHNKRKIDRGCFALYISDYGDKLKGIQTYYAGKEEFKSTTYECVR
ncbi:hypothetical protein LLH00_05920 [bacterium]|nr:hypothetical protein [bacterium]